MDKWNRRAKETQLAARYRLGQISLGEVAAELKTTTLQAMEILSAYGYRSGYSKQEFDEHRKSLQPVLDYRPPARRKKG